MNNNTYQKLWEIRWRINWNSDKGQELKKLENLWSWRKFYLETRPKLSYEKATGFSQENGNETALKKINAEIRKQFRKVEKQWAA